MRDTSGLIQMIRAKVRALLPEQWRSKVGDQFRETVGSISEFSEKHVRLKERLEEAPEILFNTAKLKSSEALVNAADEEQKRIASELARITLADKARQEKATADRLETDARVSKIHEVTERLAFFEKLRTLGVVPVWDSSGAMVFSSAPADFDWDALAKHLVKGQALGFDGRHVPNADREIIFQDDSGRIALLRGGDYDILAHEGSIEIIPDPPKKQE